MKTIYDFLNEIKKRPGMFIPGYRESLEELQTMIFGYYYALHQHKIIENIPSLNRHFLSWLRHKTGWYLSYGWAYAFKENALKNKSLLDVFFLYVNEYRKLKPQIKSSVVLKKEHNPTGKVVKYGDDTLLEKPLKIEIIQYKPELLHFLRFHYKDRIEDNDFIYKSDMDVNYKTTVDDAKKWVEDEFQVKSFEWSDI